MSTNSTRCGNPEQCSRDLGKAVIGCVVVDGVCYPLTAVVGTVLTFADPVQFTGPKTGVLRLVGQDDRAIALPTYTRQPEQRLPFREVR